ncbi:uncharacterized protein LOC110979575 isoform X2 [Acanthaster planci]|nr:uncharacterized protein LOC110979575 isoform X2 [Acanthaster planci]XP_022091199.1 uncharacterized protein LOC110979575 isoform X2 [Acanthaster planci]
MGSGAGKPEDSSDEAEASTQITVASKSSPGHQSVDNRRRSSQEQHQIVPVKRVTKNEQIDSGTAIAGATMKKHDDTSGAKSEDDLILSEKASSDFDDDAFEQFCGEIDHVLEGRTSQEQRKSSVSSSVATRPSAHHQAYPTPKHRQLVLHSHHRQQPHDTQQEEVRQQIASYQPYSSEQQHYLSRPVQAANVPPPLATRSLEKPLSTWKRPEDLAHREQVLRDQYQGTRIHTKAQSTAPQMSGMRLASREGLTMGMKQTSDLMHFQEQRAESDFEDPSLQDKEGFDISKFKAANIKKNGHKMDKLLPATYKGYGANLSRQGTLPSLHRGSISSTISSLGTPASDKQGSSPLDDGKELKYNPSEEALLDFIEKEYS